MTWFDTFWNGLGAVSYYAAITPIVFSGLNYFKLWLPSEDDLRNRCRQHREVLNEKINKSFAHIIDKARSLQGAELRGAPPKDPDLIADHTVEVFRVFYVHHALDATEATLGRVHTILLSSLVGGGICLLIALPSDKLRPYLALVAIGIFTAQVVSVFCVRRALKRLREYESGT